MICHEIPTQVLELLKTKFNVIGHMSFLEFDYNFDILKNNLLSMHRENFDLKDKIIIEHLDTDFYYPESTVGINLRNFFTVVENVDIPLNVFVFYTNHFGIQREIDIICKNKHRANRPIVLESFISKMHCPESKYKQISVNHDAITCHALSLINGIRSYRHALYNHISQCDNIAINFTPLA